MRHSVAQEDTRHRPRADAHDDMARQQPVRSLKGFGAFEAAQPPAAATAFEDQPR
jgi:hypothetical protein